MKYIPRIFIGYDDVESVAFHVLSNSIRRHASTPVSITPIWTGNLKQQYTRAHDQKQSTDFSFSRFITPHLSEYKGYALFMDCDMLCRSDIVELLDMADPTCSVQVVKHNYAPTTTVKFLGHGQHKYEKKNWSSVMLFNCGHMHTKRLTTDYVNSATGLELHQFKWTSEDRIGELPKEWNWLVGEYPHNKDAKLVHFTIGGPYFSEYENCDYSDEWFAEYRRTMRADQLFVPRLRVSAR